MPLFHIKFDGRVWNSQIAGRFGKKNTTEMVLLLSSNIMYLKKMDAQSFTSSNSYMEILTVINSNYCILCYGRLYIVYLLFVTIQTMYSNYSKDLT